MIIQLINIYPPICSVSRATLALSSSNRVVSCGPDVVSLPNFPPLLLLLLPLLLMLFFAAMIEDSCVVSLIVLIMTSSVFIALGCVQFQVCSQGIKKNENTVNFLRKFRDPKSGSGVFFLQWYQCRANLTCGQYWSVEFSRSKSLFKTKSVY